ncbi:hypothetical protein J3R83DRAFT_10729 [Lanmaoa asiatica]|nr:hypothetical protein J3R83DRAFT_10729 [Lanmaoa asiatica]
MRLIIGLVLLQAGVSITGVQQPFSAPSFREAERDEYHFTRPIQRVAVIGAGPRWPVCPPTRRIITYTRLAVA